jgi:hypothetical protein
MPTEHEIKTWLYYSPEAFFLVCMIWKKTREWWFNMIENSDGDPHHTDGLFIVLMIATLWCFREGCNAVLKHIYEGKDTKEYAIICFGTGTTLLGVRITWSAVRSKIKGESVTPNETEENKTTV